MVNGPNHSPFTTLYSRAEGASDSQAPEVGFPIRISTDQRVFAPPRGFSQRITSFIACACQGIHQLPLLYLITLIAHARTRNSKGVVAFAGKDTFQKDQLLEIDPGARLGKPIMVARIERPRRQTRTHRPVTRPMRTGVRTNLLFTMSNRTGGPAKARPQT
jgi:hypothetical protein